MLSERFRNVGQPILIRNPQKNSAFGRPMVSPPLVRESPPTRGGKTMGGSKIPKNFAPSARFYYFFNYFLLLFGLFTMLLCTRNACFSSCIQFFRACGALFLFQTFCACVESAIAACKFENSLDSSRFMNNI